MSVKNKAKDRDEHGRIRRAYTGKHAKWQYGSTPSWWTHQHMSVPRRRQNKAVCLAIMKGQDPEGAVAPLGNSKPHLYYW